MPHSYWLGAICLFYGLWSFADCSSMANIKKPSHLPDYEHCSPKDKSGCGIWEPLGDSVPSNELAIQVGPARLYQWESGNTLCFLFKRGDDFGLNGTHCYNKETCEVCAYDGKGKDFNQLEQGQEVKDDCSVCHSAGPVLPTLPVWKNGYMVAQDLNRLCASKGGPRWVDAPKIWLQPDLNKRVQAPTSCVVCHKHFVTGPNFCKFAKHALENSNGAMKKYAFEKTAEGKAECQKFAKETGCSFNCPTP